MKPLQFTSKLLLLGLCTFGARSTINAGAGANDYRDGMLGHDNARLIVRRIADFGTDIALHVYIDGTRVTTLPLNTGYEALVRPGQHVLSVCTTPNPHGKTRFTYRRVQMRRGETYNFTAMWLDGDWATLQTPSEFNASPNRSLFF
jgi:hypothetical protein